VNRKADFFYKTNRFESIRITNRIDSNRELECSSKETPAAGSGDVMPARASLGYIVQLCPAALLGGVKFTYSITRFIPAKAGVWCNGLTTSCKRVGNSLTLVPSTLLPSLPSPPLSLPFHSPFSFPFPSPALSLSLPLPSLRSTPLNTDRWSGERCSGVWGGAPAEIEFGAVYP